MSGKKDKQIRKEAMERYEALDRDERDRFIDGFKSYHRWYKKNRQAVLAKEKK